MLNARRTDEKYRGSYETNVLRRYEQFSGSRDAGTDLERLFMLVALNCAVRNGNAHLKNFAITYDDVLGEARLYPVFDVVTTEVYLPKDTMALTLNGTTQWPAARELRRLGETRMYGSPAKVRRLLERVADALADTAREAKAYMNDHGEFREIGEGMLACWEKGIKQSLAAGEQRT